MLEIVNPFRAKEGFQKLKSQKNWILALLLVLIPGLLSLAGQVMIQQKTQALTLRLVEETGMNEAQLDSFKSIQGLLTGITIVIGVAIIFIAWFLKSAVFHFFSGFMGGEKVELSSTLHLIAYTYIPFFFQGIIDLVKGMTFTTPSYEEFISQIQHPDVLLTFIRDHNIFMLWALALMIIAVREQYSLSTKKALIVVLIPYLVVWVVQIALASIGPQLGGLGGA